MVFGHKEQAVSKSKGGCTHLKGLDFSVKNFGFLAWTMTTSNKSLQSSPTKKLIPLLLQRERDEGKKFELFTDGEAKTRRSKKKFIFLSRKPTRNGMDCS
jgi:hypothetical protein